MPKIFISYRRDDSRQIVGRIDDHLSNHFGRENVFRDSIIQPGSNWKNVLQNELDKSDVLLAVIGQKWIDEFKNRDAENDWVYFEIQQGLKRGDSLKTIPVFVNETDARVLKNLPFGLEKLADKQGQKVRDEDFSYDIQKLIKAIQPQQDSDKVEIEKSTTSDNDKKWLLYFSLLVIAVLTLLLIVAYVPNLFKQSNLPLEGEAILSLNQPMSVFVDSSTTDLIYNSEIDSNVTVTIARLTKDFSFNITVKNLDTDNIIFFGAMTANSSDNLQFDFNSSFDSAYTISLAPSTLFADNSVTKGFIEVEVEN